MENNYDYITVSLGHENAFGVRLSRQELIDIVSKHPAALWLDVLAKIEAFMLCKRPDVSDVQKYLCDELLPQGAYDYFVKKRGEGSWAVFSFGAVNILRKLAIAYGAESQNVELPKADIMTALLACQDLHSDYDVKHFGGADDFDKFCKFVIRSGYLNSPTNFSTLFYRTQQMYLTQARDVTFLPDVDFRSLFAKHVGLQIEEVLALSFVLSSPFLQSKEQLIGQTTIINAGSFFEEVELSEVKARALLENLTVDIEVAKSAVERELVHTKNGFADTPLGYDVSVFRKQPMIRLKNGKLVCGNLDCFFQKTTQNLIWMLKDRIIGLDEKDGKKVVQDLASYRGHLFENYSRYILGEMSRQSGGKLSFIYVPANDANGNEEVGDALLAQGDSLVIVEAKSRQYLESFKTSGDWDEDRRFMEELISKSTEQIDVAARKIMDGKIETFPNSSQIKKIYPVIVTYEPLAMHSKVQRVIRKKVKDLNHLTDSIFAPVEVVYIGHLEELMDTANTLTLIDWLNLKSAGDAHARETSLHNFSADYMRSNTLISNGWESSQVKKFSEEVIAPNIKFKKEGD